MTEYNLDIVTEQAIVELLDIAKIAARVFMRELTNEVKYPAIGTLRQMFDNKVDDIKRDIIHKIVVS